MNMSDLITRIKIACGIYAIALPFENPDEAIADVIRRVTLRTFSTYCPYCESIQFDTLVMEPLEKHANQETYLLPDIFSQREILYVKNVRYDESDISALGYWGGGVPILHGNMLRQAMLSNAALNLSNRIIPKITFKYEHPRKITLYNMLSSTKLIFDIAFVHDSSLASITPSSEESFYNLALLDVQNFLYQSLKHYKEIKSAYGTINLQIDDWQNAESARKELLNDWDNTYHMDIIPYVWA